MEEKYGSGYAGMSPNEIMWRAEKKAEAAKPPAINVHIDGIPVATDATGESPNNASMTASRARHMMMTYEMEQKQHKLINSEDAASMFGFIP